MLKNACYIIILLGFACCWHQPNPGRKMDARLRHAVAAQDTLIHFTGKCTQTIDDDMQKRIEDTGVKIQTLIGRHFTAAGNSEGVTELSTLKIIERLQAAKPMKPRR